MTGRFEKMMGCFLLKSGRTEKNKGTFENEDRREGTLESKNEFVKIPIITLSRAYAYARINRRFIIFAVTSVTGL